MSILAVAQQLQTLGASLHVYMVAKDQWSTGPRNFQVTITYHTGEGDKIEIARSSTDFETAMLGAYAAFKNIAQRGVALPLLAAPTPNGWTTIEGDAAQRAFATSTVEPGEAADDQPF